MSNYKQTVEIEGNERTVEKVIHELFKECDNANRYGEDISIRRIPEETEHEADFNE